MCNEAARDELAIGWVWLSNALHLVPNVEVGICQALGGGTLAQMHTSVLATT